MGGIGIRYAVSLMGPVVHHSWGHFRVIHGGMAGAYLQARVQRTGPVHEGVRVCRGRLRALFVPLHALHACGVCMHPLSTQSSIRWAGMAAQSQQQGSCSV